MDLFHANESDLDIYIYIFEYMIESIMNGMILQHTGNMKHRYFFNTIQYSHDIVGW